MIILSVRGSAAKKEAIARIVQNHDTDLKRLWQLKSQSAQDYVGRPQTGQKQ